MTYTYIRLPRPAAAFISVLLIGFSLALLGLGWRAAEAEAEMKELKARLEAIETRLAEMEEVYEQAGQIRQYILRAARCTPRQATEIAYQIIATARIEGLDPALLAGVAKVESGFNPAAVGRLGERGLVQVRPATFASWHAGDINDWRAALEAGARFLSSCLRRFRWPRLALAAYNAGPSRPPAEILAVSGRYADRVLAAKAAIERGRG